ncbi:MAG: serine/threonine-protein kinase [Isosphaeraceae bacterium]
MRELLRRRLRAIALVVAAANAIAVLQYALDHDPNSDPAYLAYIVNNPIRFINHFHVPAYLVLAVLASKSPPRTLGTLRLFEALIFFGGFNFTSIYNWRVLVISDWLPAVLRYGVILSTAISMNWFFIIVGYGTLIPNTGRRCAGVVIGMALFALALNAVALRVNPAVPAGELIQYLLTLTVWMMYAVVIAIVGSHRLEKLRREAAAARQLGQYRLKELLGAGGMGEVYLAEHVLLRRPCAVKLIHPVRASDARQIARFAREVQTTATLSHPNTVQVYDYGHTEDGTFYYAMEYLPGLTLEQLVERDGPLLPARAVHILRQVCGSLLEAHEAGLVHRDLKPSNVMICIRGGVHDVAKLLDFGLVLPRADETRDREVSQEGTITGTPSYMSPEQAGGQEDLDPRSDIYSLGALAYFLLTGRPPFVAPNVVKTLAAHVYEQPSPLRLLRPEVPPELEAVILRCLEKRPENRPATAGALEAELARSAGDGGWRPEDAAAWWTAFRSRG